MAQLVRGQTGGQRRLVTGGEQLVGALDRWGQHAVSEVVLVAGRPVAVDEDQIVCGGVCGGLFVGVEGLLEDWQQVDLAQAGLGL